jgi:hypothetical protein
MRNWQKDEVLQFVFHRLNTQVTPLSTHELRRALLAGKFTTYLDERSARMHGIQRILNITEPDYRLRDAELLLRAIAFSCFFARYKGNLKAFLDSATRTLNGNWSDGLANALEAVTTDIDEAIGATYDVFDDDAFQRLDAGRATGRFNRAIFDIMVMSFRHSDVRERARQDSGKVSSLFARLMEDDEFSGWTEATTKSRSAVEGRVKRWSAELGRVLGIPGLEHRALESPLGASLRSRS